MTVASLYLPSGSASPEKHQAKLKFMQQLSEDMKAMKRKRREFVICGDFNVVHKEIDITNWKSNQKNSGCTPEDQAWVTKTIDEIGYTDAFREVNKKAGEYTWWSNRGNARANNVGWRIDYHFVTPGLKIKLRKLLFIKRHGFLIMLRLRLIMILRLIMVISCEVINAKGAEAQRTQSFYY